MLYLVGWLLLTFLIQAIVVYSVLDISYKLSAPPLNFIRRFLPNLGSIDISPVILILGLMFLRNFVFEMFAPGLFLR